MSENAQSSPSLLNTLLKILSVIFFTSFFIVIFDGLSALLSIATLGLLTGPFTFSWWPYFRNEIGLFPLFGIVPITLIILGLRFRSSFKMRLLGYIGGFLWVASGFLYVVSHIK